MSDTKFTRRELYDLVWSTPMSKLAGQYGISDVGLKKTCKRHRIPTPPRGYWAKVEAGQKPKQARLAKISDVRLDQIKIVSSGFTLPEPVRRVIAIQKAERKRAAPPPQQPDPTATEPLVNVHPALRRIVRALRQCKSTEPAAHTSGEGLSGVSVARNSIERAVSVLDRLARLLAEKRTPLVVTERAMQVSDGLETVVIGLTERTRKVAHVPTAEELAEEAHQRTQIEQFRRSPNHGSLQLFKRAYPEKDTVWTGELMIQVDGYGEGVRRSWADGRTQRLEDLVPLVVDGIEVLLTARKARREAREEQARQWAEQERRRRLASARQEREKARLTFLNDLVARRRNADALRRALAEIGSNLSLSESSQVARMMSWGEARLREMDEQLRTAQIEKQLVEAKLFPDASDDELYDLSGKPPQLV